MNEATWACPHCGAENSDMSQICAGCDRQRDQIKPMDIVGGGIAYLRPTKQKDSQS